MSGADDSPDLDRLVRLFEAADKIPGKQDKYIALALGIDRAQVSRWRKMVDDGKETRLNDASRDAIASLGNPGIAWGMEVMVEHLRTTLEEMEGALRVRRAMVGGWQFTPGGIPLGPIGGGEPSPASGAALAALGGGRSKAGGKKR